MDIECALEFMYMHACTHRHGYDASYTHTLLPVWDLKDRSV
jgi:hypothetical protein